MQGSQRTLPRFSAVFMAVLLAGCSLSPDYTRPDAPVPSTYPGQNNANQATVADLGWEQFFREPRLKALIGLALENNRDMRIAVKRVDEARAQYGITRSDQFPQIGATAQETAQRMPPNLRMAGPDSPSVSRSFTAGIGITDFELDFFGKQRNLSEAAFQAYLATVEGRKTAQINLIGQLATAYYNLRAAQQQRDLVAKTLKSRQSTYDLVQTRFRGGVASALDVNQAKNLLDSARASSAELDRSEQLARNALQLIIGAPIPAGLPAASPFAGDVLMAKIPAGLPSDLLVRRPDIIAAEHELLAANANIGAARAAFFPSISLTGLIGSASLGLGTLFSGGQGSWSFNPVITMPIFTAGRLRNNLELSEVRKDIAVAQYEKSIQTAFKEVADSLAGEATYGAQLQALRDQQKSAYESLNLSDLRYRNGIDSFLQVQTAQINLFTVQQSFVQVGLESLLNKVELYKALGGGWNRDTTMRPNPDAPLTNTVPVSGNATQITPSTQP